MNKSTFLIICYCFAAGVLFFLINQRILIVRWPETEIAMLQAQHAPKKTALMRYFTDGKWHSEKITLIWSCDTYENLSQLIAQWLSIAKEEKQVNPSVSLLAIPVSVKPEHVFISLSETPFLKNSSSFQKWMVIEGLLKTIRENDVPIQKVTFLVLHKTLEDSDLDFTDPWPIAGFLDL